MTDRRLKIGLDYHGVIDKKTEYFAEFCTLARQHGHQIYVITGGPEVKVKEYLKSAHIPYDFIFAILDYYQALGKTTMDANGNIAVPDELWNKAKADFCRRNRINIHIDDSCEYLNWFSTPFCLYEHNGGVCHLPAGIKIDLRRPPSEALGQIESAAKKFSV